jgi:hypothetical protein
MPEQLQQRLNELRVAHHELRMLSPPPSTTTSNNASTITSNKTTSSSSTNNNNNNVYIQFSSGSVAMLMDRSVAEARVTRQIQAACTELERLEQ